MSGARLMPESLIQVVPQTLFENSAQGDTMNTACRPTEAGGSAILTALNRPPRHHNPWPLRPNRLLSVQIATTMAQ